MKFNRKIPGKTIQIPSFFIFIILFLIVSICGLYPQKFPEIEVDLGSGTFKKYLPFDTHFMIKGPVTKDIVEIAVWWLEKKKTEIGKTILPPFDEEYLKNIVRANLTACTAYFTLIRYIPSYIELKLQYLYFGVKALDILYRWNQIEPSWKNTFSSDEKYFYILAPPLNANRYYQFYFKFSRKLSAQELNDFKKQITDNFDMILRNEKPEDDDIKNLQEKLIDALPKSEGKVINTASGSIFDTSKEGLESMKKKVDDIIRLLEPQAERDGIIIDFNEATERNAKNFLLKFSENKILLAINAVITRNPKIFERLFKQSELAFKLANLGKEETREIIRGETPLIHTDSTNNIPIEKIENAWKPIDCDIRIKNLKELFISLRKIRSLLLRVLSDFDFFKNQHPEIRKREGLNELMVELKKSEDIIDGIHHRLLRLRTELTVREKRIADLANQIAVLAKSYAYVMGDSGGEFKTRATWHLNPDIGLSYAPVLKEVLPYFGVNIYFRPVNKEVPLNQKGGFGRRFAAVIGITTSSIELENQRKGLLGKKALMIGAGYRITDAIRISTGSLVFHEINPNPLISEKRFSTSLFISLSIDWDIKSTLGILGKAIAGE